MSHMRSFILKHLLVLALLGGCESHCPASCRCDPSTKVDETVLYCDVGRHTLKLSFQEPYEYLTIDCQDNFDYTCSDMSTLELNMTVKSLHLWRCPRRLLQCNNTISLLKSSTYLYFNQDGVKKELSERDEDKQLGDLQSLRLDRVKSPSNRPVSMTGLMSLANYALVTGYSPAIFQKMTNLKRLRVIVDCLRKDMLKGLDHLEELNLYNNNIEEGALCDVPTLRVVDITYTKITEIPTGLFTGLENLQEIILRQNRRMTSLRNLAFANMPSLKMIDMGYGNIERLAEDLFVNSTSLLDVILMHNSIRHLPAKLFEDQTRLKSLDLSQNLLEQLPEGFFQSLVNLETLQLSDNELTVLSDVTFVGLQSLNHLDLTHNQLTTINPSAFVPTPQLTTLDLAWNKLTLPSPPPSPFHVLRGLQNLFLSENQLEVIFDDWRNELKNLSVLDLKKNLFQELELEDLLFQANNITIDLRDNLIEAIHFPFASQHRPNHNVVLLENNPLACDCRLYPLAVQFQGNTTTGPKFDVGVTTCGSPAKYKAYYIKNFSPHSLICDLPLRHNPDNCSCVMRAPTNAVLCDCKANPIVFPKTSNSVNLRLHEQPNSISNLKVQTLNLSGLDIKHVELKPSETLEVIDLSNNKLEVPPVKLLDANISLYLAHNPFKCECWYVKELTAAVNSHLVVDKSDFVCEGGDRINIDVLCRSDRTFDVALSVVLSALVFVFIVVVICYYYSNDIVAYLLRKGIGTSYFADEDLDKEYDVFVSFSHKDLAFVEELVGKLENEFKLKTCVHHRDWNIGEFIATQITRSVESSRKTVLVLSKHYLDSMWAALEFNVAQTIGLREREARVVAILLEDVTKEPNLPDEINEYLLSQIYLKRSDPMFWEKLRRSLPQKRKKFLYRKTNV